MVERTVAFRIRQERMSCAIYVRLVGLVVLAIACSKASAEGWTTYRHDTTRSGVTTERVSPPLWLYWTFKPNLAPTPAWPEPAEEMPRMHQDSGYHVAVTDGTVYFATSMDNKVYAVKASTGKVRWTFYAEGPIRFAPTVWQDRVYFGSDDGYVYCLKASNGNLVWKYRAGPSDEKVIGNGRVISLWPVRTSVLVDKAIVYFGAGVFPYEGIYSCALQANDGTVVWKNDTIGDLSHELQYGGITPHGYLIASEETLYVPSGRAMPAAFDRGSGEFLYSCSPGGKVGGTWALVDDESLIAGVDRSGTPAKVAFDQITGKRKGDAYAWFPGLDLLVTPDVSYAVTKDGIHAIARAAYPTIGEKLNKIRADQQKLATMLSDMQKKLLDVDEKLREELNKQIDEMTRRMNELADEEKASLKAAACKWQYPRKNLCSLILAGDVVFAGGEGIVVAVDAETGKELWNYELDGRTCGLAATKGYFFVSTEKGHIYCFGERKVSRPREIFPTINPSPYRKDKLTPVYEAAAETIVRETGIKKGYCLVLGCGTGRLVLELAKRTDLKIVGIEKDPTMVEKAKANLDAAGLYGSRAVVEPWSLSTLPDYFANLIVSDEMMRSDTIAVAPQEMFRVLRPCGGVAFFGQPKEAARIAKPLDLGSRVAWLKQSGMPEPELVGEGGHWAKVTRGKLEGAGSWTHLYANPANTACSDDQLVKSPLGVLWYGEPGPEGIVERHARVPSAVSMDGRLFVQGEEIIMAYDAYNGTLLWKRNIPGAVRVRADVDGGNLALAANGLYVAAHDKCYRLCPGTGEILRTYEMPSSRDGSPRRWGYVACTGETLFGSAAMPLKQEYAAVWKNLVRDDGTWKGADEIASQFKAAYEAYVSRYSVADEEAKAAFQREGGFWHSMASFPSRNSQKSPKNALTNAMMVSDSIFAINPETGEQLWEHRGGDIANITPTIGGGMIFFAENSVAEEEKQSALKEKQNLIERKIYVQEDEKSLEPEDADVRRVVALNAATGEKVWERCFDLTGCGGDKMGASYDDGILLFFGHFSNHDKGFFESGQLRWRRITAVSAKTGDVLWSRPLDYLRRPLIVGDRIIIEPRACDVRTGQIEMRSHPITNRRVPWEFLRPGHSCGIISAAPSFLFYRSYCAAFYDVLGDVGLVLFGAIRAGCWLEIIAANGLLLFPEGSSGCTCSFPLRCTVVLKPKNPHRPSPWSVFVTHGAMTPAKRLAINFGAPGDMKDEKGTMWFGYPRPQTSYGVKFDLKEEFLEGMGPFCRDFRGLHVEGSDKPWLFASGYLGLARCDVPLIDDCWGEKAGIYTVRLGFVAPESDRAGQRVFDITIQGNTVLEDFDIFAAAGAPNKAVIKEFNGVKVANCLLLEFISKVSSPTLATAPWINCIEVIREDEREIGPPREPTNPLEKSYAEALLKTAGADLDKGNWEEALKTYHTVLDTAATSDLQGLALEGIATIGRPESLSRLARYCRDDAPILWDYHPPESDVKECATKAYVAIAKNVANSDKQKAIRMLDSALSLSITRATRQQALSHYVAIANSMATENKEKAIAALQNTLKLAGRDLEVRQRAVVALEDLGIELATDAAEKGFVTRWHLIGPFPWGEKINNLDRILVGEPNVDLHTSYTVGKTTLRWQEFTSDNRTIDLGKLYRPNENVSAYAYAEVILRQRQDLLLEVRSDDGFKCWFNGEVVGMFLGPGGRKASQNRLKIEGKPGLNTILLKTAQSGGSWTFSVKLMDANGRPIRSPRR